MLSWAHSSRRHPFSAAAESGKSEQLPYSNFFSSGLQAIRPRKAQVKRPRPASMFAMPTGSSSLSGIPMVSGPSQFNTEKSSYELKENRDVSPSRSRSPTHNSDAKRSRRSSLMSLSSRLIGEAMPLFPFPSRSRKSSMASKRSSQYQAPVAPNRKSESHDEDVTEVWITKGGPFTIVPRPEPIVTVLQDIDPFASSPDSRSYFIDLADSPSTAPVGESFIHFTTPTSPGNSFNISLSPRPTTRSDSPARQPALSSKLRSRRRPLSAQTMPLPSESRRSSLSVPVHRRDNFDLGLDYGEASPVRPLSGTLDVVGSLKHPVAQGGVLGLMLEEQVTELEEKHVGPSTDDPQVSDAVNLVDWRQFHIEHLLTDE